MSAVAAPILMPPIVYPESDGKPIAENTLQYQWIVTITGGLDHLFADDPDVFVAADVFWYPVEGRPDICVAPDTLVVFGRPKGHRGSYRQWEEGGIPPQVVFEILSPGNRVGEMTAKFEFYRRHGVEEYYIFDPDPDELDLSGFIREGPNLNKVPQMNGFVSPRLGIRFELTDNNLRIIRPDGRPFETQAESMKRADTEHERAERERQRADQATKELELLRGQLRSDGADR